MPHNLFTVNNTPLNQEINDIINEIEKLLENYLYLINNSEENITTEMNEEHFKNILQILNKHLQENLITTPQFYNSHSLLLKIFKINFVRIARFNRIIK